MQTLRIFISSPGDVAEERDRARQVVESLRRRYAGQFYLKPVLWEELPLQADMSFQQGIDLVLSKELGIDIAVFILWSRLGSPLGALVRKPDGREYRSGTERELDLMLQARRQSGGKRPALMVYTRRDETSFDERLRGKPTQEKEDLIAQKKLVEQFIAEEFHDGGSGHNVRAYHSFDRPVTFSQRLRAHLTELLDEMAGGGLTECVWDIEKQGPPFQGLAAFQPEHADVFFGREQETLEARHALREQARNGCAFLLLSGASGSGKSSLAKAGVLPAVVENEIDEQVSTWQTVIVTPQELGSDPLSGLIRRLAGDDVVPELRGEETTADDVADDLRTQPGKTVQLWFKEAFARASRRAGGGVRLMILLDQLEEIFASAAVSEQDRAEFLNALEALARSGLVWVLATVRSDFWAQVQAQPALARMMEGRGVLPVLPPETDALRRLIEEPARLAGLTYETRDGQSLADAILRDAAAHAELLPLLEYVLRELFEQRTGRRELTWAVYEELGGVEGALAKRAEAMFQTLPPEARAALDRVLKALATIGQDGHEGGRDSVVRQRVTMQLFEDDVAAQSLVDVFVKERLFTTGRDAAGKAVIMVTHESLLRVWPRAVAWAELNREFLRIRSRISARMIEGSPLLEGDPLLNEAKALLVTEPRGFTRHQADFITTCVEAARSRSHRREQIRKRVLGALSLMLIASVGGFAWALKKSSDESRQRSIAQQRQKEADDSRLKAEQEQQKQAALLLTASQGDQGAALRAFTEGEHGQGLAYFERALRNRPDNSTALVGSAIHAFGMAAPPWKTRWVEVFDEKVTCLRFSANGRVAAVGSMNGTLRFFDAAGGQEIRRVMFEEGVTTAAFSADGKWIVAGTKSGKVSLIEVGTGAEIKKWETGAKITEVALSPDQRCLAVGCGNKEMRLMDVEAGNEIGRASFGSNLMTIGFEIESRQLGFSPDGRLLALATQGNSVVIIETMTARQLVTIDCESEAACVVFSPDGRHLAVMCEAGSLFVADAATGMRGFEFKREAGIWAGEFSPDGRLLAFGDDDGVLTVVAAATGSPIWETSFNRRVASVRFSPDGNMIAAGGHDNTVRFFQSSSGAEMGTIELADHANEVIFSPDGRFVGCFSRDNCLRVLEPAGGHEGHIDIGERVNGVCFASEGRRLLVGSDSKSLDEYDLLTGSLRRQHKFEESVMSVSLCADGSQMAVRLFGDTGWIMDSGIFARLLPLQVDFLMTDLRLSPDGKTVSAASHTHANWIFDAESGDLQQKVDMGAPVNAVCFSPDGRWMAAGAHEVAIVERATGNLLSSWEIDGLTSLASSYDGRRLAMGGTARENVGGMVRIIDVASGAEVSRSIGFGQITSLSFSPNDRWLASSDYEGSFRVIEVETGLEVANLQSAEVVQTVSFSADGRWLVRGGSYERVSLVDARWMAAPPERVTSAWQSALAMQSAQRFDSMGRREDVRGEELGLAQAEARKFIEVPPKPGEGWQHEILRWSQLQPEERTTSPWTHEPIRSAVGRWLMAARTDTPTIQDCAHQAPWHPLEPVSLARLEIGAGEQLDDASPRILRTRFLAKLTLTRLRDADENLYGRDTLATYAAWAAKIMHEELKLDAEAREAVVFALERTPREKEGQLMELRAKLDAPQ